MRRLLSVQVLALVLAGGPAAAQEPWAPAAPRPYTLILAEGQVDLVREARVQPARPPDLLDDDDRLVSREGRAELAGVDGTRVHLDRATDMRLDAAERPHLVRGRVVVHTPRDADAVTLGTPAGWLDLDPDGEYDVAANDLDGDTVVAVTRGRAVLHSSRQQDVTITGGDALRIDPREAEPRWSRAPAPDAFLRWVRVRVPPGTTATGDRHEWPAPLAPYASQLTGHGTWTTLAPYGEVWFPAAASAWRPYTHGAWRATRYGWTWIDSEPWAWPLHHFGRWGRPETRGWYWLPERTWGPAWVGWAIGAEHVAWSPLGWDARPVADFLAGVRADPTGAWANSWSVVPRRSFGRPGSMATEVQDPRALPGPVLGGFVSQMIGPRGPAGTGDRFAARPAWPSRDRSSFGSAAVAREIAPRREPPPVPPPGAAARTAPASPQYRDRPAAQQRGAHAIRPRDEPPPAAAPPSSNPSTSSRTSPTPSTPRTPAPPPQARPRDRGPETRGAGAGQGAAAGGSRRRPG